MRYRLLFILMGVLTVVMSPTVSSAAPAGLSRSPQIGSCPKAGGMPEVGQQAATLPRLPAQLAEGLRGYGREAAANATDLAWYDSGGRFGGGVPVAAVGAMMRAGLVDGLSQSAVASFLNPGFLRGISDPYGGGGILAFIIERDDPALFTAVAEFAAAADPAIGGPMEAQQALFVAFPLLNVVYEAQAGVPPLDETGAVTMEELANGGYRPAQRTIDRILAGGNHPRAGAQGSGSVADGVQPEVYDYFVENYVGPLSPAAAAAVANRSEYNAWVDRIATWVDGGGLMEEVPDPAVFPAPVTSTTSAVEGTSASAC